MKHFVRRFLCPGCRQLACGMGSSLFKIMVAVLLLLIPCSILGARSLGSVTRFQGVELRGTSGSHCALCVKFHLATCSAALPCWSSCEGFLRRLVQLVEQKMCETPDLSGVVKVCLSLSPDHRVSRAEALVHMGELSSSRQAFEGASLAPGTDDTLVAWRRRLVPRDAIPEHLTRSAPQVPFALDEGQLNKYLRSAKRGAAPGPSCMTVEHLHPLLDHFGDFRLCISHVLQGLKMKPNATMAMLI